MWNVEHSVETNADPEAVWRCFEDVAGWPRWVPEFQWSRLIGPFEAGSTIENKAKGLPVARVTLATVTYPSFFRTESRLLGMHLVFDHWVEARATATQVRVRMNFGGPLAPILRLVRGHATAASLRESLNRLSELAVADSVAQSSSE